MKYHKIRKITGNNITGDSYGITLPKYIIKEFGICNVNIYLSGCAIILESGNNFRL